jgi:hypothetical protein
MILANAARELSEKGERRTKHVIKLNEEQKVEDSLTELTRKADKFSTYIKRNYEEKVLYATDDGKTEINYETDERYMYQCMDKKEFKIFLKENCMLGIKKELEGKGFKVKIKLKTRVEDEPFGSVLGHNYVHYVDFKITW